MGSKEVCATYTTVSILLDFRSSASVVRAVAPTYLDRGALKVSQYDKVRFELKKPLMIVKAEKGFLACGYINPETCNKTGEACAIVTGVSTYEDMYGSPVVAVSEKAQELGVEIGEPGSAALAKMS